MHLSLRYAIELSEVRPWMMHSRHHNVRIIGALKSLVNLSKTQQQRPMIGVA